jgi:hypothetical protein
MCSEYTFHGVYIYLTSSGSVAPPAQVYTHATLLLLLLLLTIKQLFPKPLCNSRGMRNGSPEDSLFKQFNKQLVYSMEL